MQETECQVYTPEQAAALLGVSVSTVLRACDAGDLESIKIRSTRRIPRPYLDRLLGIAQPEEATHA